MTGAENANWRCDEIAEPAFPFFAKLAMEGAVGGGGRGVQARTRPNVPTNGRAAKKP
jgi:hypothetical protein